MASSPPKEETKTASTAAAATTTAGGADQAGVSAAVAGRRRVSATAVILQHPAPDPPIFSPFEVYTIWGGLYILGDHAKGRQRVNPEFANTFSLVFDVVLRRRRR